MTGGSIYLEYGVELERNFLGLNTYDIEVRTMEDREKDSTLAAEEAKDKIRQPAPFPVRAAFSHIFSGAEKPRSWIQVSSTRWARSIRAM